MGHILEWPKMKSCKKILLDYFSIVFKLLLRNTIGDLNVVNMYSTIFKHIVKMIACWFT